jgi:hypothetical protein
VQGSPTTESAGQNAEPASPAETSPSLAPIPNSINQQPTDSIPSATARGAGYNDLQAVAGEKAWVEGGAANTAEANSVSTVSGYTPRIDLTDSFVPQQMKGPGVRYLYRGHGDVHYLDAIVDSEGTLGLTSEQAVMLQRLAEVRICSMAL